MNNVPYFYDYQNAEIAPVTPNTVHIKDTGLYWYFQKYLLQKAMSVFKWELPDTWNKDYFLYVLYCTGRVAVLNKDNFLVIQQGSGLKG